MSVTVIKFSRLITAQLAMIKVTVSDLKHDAKAVRLDNERFSYWCPTASIRVLEKHWYSL